MPSHRPPWGPLLPASQLNWWGRGWWWQPHLTSLYTLPFAAWLPSPLPSDATFFSSSWISIQPFALLQLRGHQPVNWGENLDKCAFRTALSCTLCDPNCLQNTRSHRERPQPSQLPSGIPKHLNEASLASDDQLHTRMCSSLQNHDTYLWF